MTVQKQILDLLTHLRGEGMSLVTITHDLGVVERFADEMIVMRSGEVVEAGSALEIFSNPQHEYTRTLLDAVLPVHAEAA